MHHQSVCIHEVNCAMSASSAPYFLLCFLLFMQTCDSTLPQPLLLLIFSLAVNVMDFVIVVLSVCVVIER